MDPLLLILLGVIVVGYRNLVYWVTIYIMVVPLDPRLQHREGELKGMVRREAGNGGYGLRFAPFLTPHRRCG